ncbi:sugar ABC transporter ATP-binding protein [Kaistia nematophila]|uniref:Sugar ABC transporter ATP-binding protein n=1 Tax=Kaistia nematophila TaxID=2994654 RepID=A0A9X3IMA7_9HYPH|nr:sugar ABC transporter ATP-binding protein [Kaistia nematophila]MCX5570722.1 sugar ABC transporter ATP-binding protein [Kaistia nematophila]
MNTRSDDLALELAGLVKQYGPVRALDGANLSVRRGEVHGLIGQNGAGKSTMIKILSGLERADAGEIKIRGEAVEGLTPAEVLTRGIGVIYQDRMTIPSFTVEEALFYATPAASANGVTVNRRALRRRADELIERYFGVGLPKNRLLRDLTTAEQQVVHITRTLLLGPHIVVLDEPTAALARREVESLFRGIEAMRQDGITVVYISHYLREIKEICDRITVLRNGRDVAILNAGTASIEDMTGPMIGSDIGSLFPARGEKAGAPFFVARGLGRRSGFRDVDLVVRKGEIVGVTGLIGSGIKEFTRVLFGLDAAHDGVMEIDGAAYAPRTPRDALAAGLALVPEDRRTQGVGLPLSLRENIVLASLERFSRFGFMRRDAETKRARGFIASLSIKAPDETVSAGSLSGGNQQKVAIAKWLCREASLYVLDEPTVGIDVAAKAEIYRLLRGLADAGHSLIVVSSDLDEVRGLADRVVVLHRGSVALDARSETVSPSALLAAVVGGRPEEAHDIHHH